MFALLSEHSAGHNILVQLIATFLPYQFIPLQTSSFIWSSDNGGSHYFGEMVLYRPNNRVYTCNHAQFVVCTFTQLEHHILISMQGIFHSWAILIWNFDICIEFVVTSMWWFFMWLRGCTQGILECVDTYFPCGCSLSRTCKGVLGNGQNSGEEHPKRLIKSTTSNLKSITVLNNTF